MVLNNFNLKFNGSVSNPPSLTRNLAYKLNNKSALFVVKGSIIQCFGRTNRATCDDESDDYFEKFDARLAKSTSAKLDKVKGKTERINN